MNINKKLIILLNFIIVLIAYNYSIYKSEKLIEESSLVFFELAPADPRSLMQGDYMRLNYTNSTLSNSEISHKKGVLVFNLDSQNVAHKIRLQEQKYPLEDNEKIIRYSKRNSWQLNFGAESYFFQEGDADIYAEAKYGGLRINEEGKSILIGLYNKSFELLGEKED